MTIRSPAPRPCESCPYRTDTPAGVWDDSEYRMLTAYDAPTPEQPDQVFLCHQTDVTDELSRLCGGWVACHGDELLALRLAAARRHLVGVELEATMTYVSPVPLFSSGTAAADHGITGAGPDAAAQQVQRKIQRRRCDLT